MLGVLGEIRGEEAAGKYRFVLPLGQGGTADVYLAVADGPSGFQKLVVLKVLKQSLTSDEELRAMFLTEARLAARLQHPNIVQTYEVLEDEGRPIIVMEYLEGQPLSQVIVRGRAAGFSLAMQVRVIIDALSGLHAAHELTDYDGTPLGVVHRDVSPHNLFVTIEGQTKVLDFGIAKLQRSLVETEVGTIKGKLRYMAPEQIAGEKLDRRADVYAAGVILWEALAGVRMWSGCSEEEIRARVRSGALPEWRERSHGRASLESICRRALALSPADRPATALELADDLEAALPQLGRPPTHREIGATLARLFADVRAQTREAIERKLGPLSAGAVAAAIDPSVNRTTETSLPLPQQATASGMASPRARRWVWLGTTAAVAALLAAFGLWRTGVFSSGRRALVETAPLAPAPAPPTPASAAPAARAAETAVEAPRPERSPAAPRVPGRRAPRPTSSANPPVPPPPDCAHPFFVDGDGIKRFRPECL